MSRILTAVAALCGITGAIATPPASPPAMQPAPSTPAETAAEHLLTVMHVDDQFRDLMPKIIEVLLPALVVGNSGRETDLRKIVSEEFETEMLQSMRVIHATNRQLMATHFTVHDLDDLAAFYASPLGQKVVREMPVIQMQMLQVGQQIGRTAMQAALPRIIQRMRAANMAVPQGV